MRRLLLALCFALAPWAAEAASSVATSWPTNAYALTDGATITVPCPGSADGSGIGVSGFYTLTVLGNNHAISLPSCSIPSPFLFRITQGAGGPYTGLTFSAGSNTVYLTGGAVFSQTQTAGAIDDAGGQIVSSTIWDFFAPQYALRAPPTFVQAKFGAKITSGTSVPVTMTSPLTAGNSVACLAVYNGSGSISGVSDGTNSYTSVAGPTAIGSAKVQSFKLIALTGSPSTITATITSAVTAAGIECMEVAGASTVDVQALNVQASFNGFATDSVTSGNVTTTNAGELLVGMSLVTSGVQINAGTGQTLATHDTTGTALGFIEEYKTIGAAGSYASTFTSTDNSTDSYGSQTMAFY